MEGELKMISEMMRPMTVGKGTIYEVLLDADNITDFDVMGDMLTIQHKHESHIHFPDKSEKEIFQNFVFQLAQALNPPILVTEAVLEAMEKAPEAKFKVLEAGLLPKLFRERVGCKTKKEGGTEWIYGKTYYYDSWVDGIKKELEIDYDYIQADCPLALQVLLGFTTKGVPVNE